MDEANTASDAGMSQSASPLEQPDEQTQQAAVPVEKVLEQVLEHIDTPEKAEALVDRLVADTLEVPAAVAEQVAPHADAEQPAEQAAAAATNVEEAVAAAPATDVDKAAAAVETVAAEAEALDGPAYEAVVGAIQEVTDPALTGQPERLEQPRRYVRDAIMRRMSPFQKYDTALFLAINNDLPRVPAVNSFFRHLSFWFNGGWAWIIGVALFLPFRRQEASAILRRISVPIWVAAGVVEGPIKKYFRRKRPFIDIVRAVVIGKKPGNWSFPSGHAAAAFAGARMMSRCLPRWQPAWYSVAALVGFSRVYLGAHYPGDVLSGTVIGLLLAEATRRLMRRL